MMRTITTYSKRAPFYGLISEIDSCLSREDTWTLSVEGIMPRTRRKPANSLRSLLQRLVNNKCHLTLVVVLLLAAALAQAQTFTVLHSFTDGSDGGIPVAGLIEGTSGNLYGTTYQGGDLNCASEGCGTVYEISSSGTET